MCFCPFSASLQGEVGPPGKPGPEGGFGTLGPAGPRGIAVMGKVVRLHLFYREDLMHMSIWNRLKPSLFVYIRVHQEQEGKKEISEDLGVR